MRLIIRNITISGLLAVTLLIFRNIIYIPINSVTTSTLGIFVQILGTLYGIMAAFIIYVVWERYNKISEISERETDSLSELYALGTYLEDKQLNLRIKNAITEYANTVIVRGWEKLSRGEKSKKADIALHKIYKEIRATKSNRRRFPVIFGQIVAKYKDVSDLRTQRVSMSAEHLPISLRILIIFESLALVFSIVLLPITNFGIALLIVLVTSTTVALILQVIFDLDNPLAPGEWQLTPQAFEDLIKELDERG